jgi:hypothetical protein
MEIKKRLIFILFFLLILFVNSTYAQVNNCDQNNDGIIDNNEMADCITYWISGFKSNEVFIYTINLWKGLVQPISEICNDNIDNNDNGVIDCDEASCIGSYNCCKEIDETCNTGECCNGLGCYDGKCGVGKHIGAIDHPINEWIIQNPTEENPSPSFGWEGAGSYDPFNHVWIHEGGHDIYSVPQGYLLGAWDFNTGKWKLKFAYDAPPGTCCIDGSSSYDLANRKYVKTVGASLSHGWQWIRSVRLRDDDIWLYDYNSNRWIETLPPPYDKKDWQNRIARLDIASTYDTKRQITWFFGGTFDSGTNNLHYYDAHSNSLVKIDTINPPSRRDHAGFSYDKKHDAIVLFGSQYVNDEKTYIYNITTKEWTAFDLEPRPRSVRRDLYASIPNMIYDEIHEIHLVTIYIENIETAHRWGEIETWEFNMSNMKWRKLTPLQQVPNSLSRSRNLDFNPELNLFFLENIWSNEYRNEFKNQLLTFRYGEKTTEYNNKLLAPKGIKLITEENQIKLEWLDSQTSEIDKYNIYRSSNTFPELDFEKIDESTSLNFIDENIDSNEIYFYQIKTVKNNIESEPSFFVKSQPQFMKKPIVSVLSTDHVKISWNSHDAEDVIGYNIYRGIAEIYTSNTISDAHYVTKKCAYTDPIFDEPVIDNVHNVKDIIKLNSEPITNLFYDDFSVDLNNKGEESGDYKYAVHAYIIKAVNKLDVESGPSAYTITIPSAPKNVRLYQNEIIWDEALEESVIGYKIYMYNTSYGPNHILTDEPFSGNSYTIKNTPVAVKNIHRFWVVPIDVLGQEGIPSVPVYYEPSWYEGFYEGNWHQ